MRMLFSRKKGENASEENGLDPLGIIRRVRILEIRTKNLVDTLLQGAYHSVFKGRGIEFSEVREYVPGDDIRSIDWNVSARMNKPFVKEFVEERDLTMLLLFDVSPSLALSFQEKREKAVELAASIVMSAMRNNDRCGLVLFSDRIEKFIPPRKGRRHALLILRELACPSPQREGTDVGVALRFARRVLKQRSIVFVISDFVSSDFAMELKHLAARNDVVGIRMVCPEEAEIPSVGIVAFEDVETGEQILVDTAEHGFGSSYRSFSSAFSSGLKESFGRSRASMLEVRTDEDMVLALKRFFRDRIKRINR